MKLFSIVLGVFLYAVQAQAETNGVRALTLRQAIDLALEHNLDIQIERYNPLLSRIQLYGAYGAYDVGFNISGRKVFETSPSDSVSPPDEDSSQVYTAGLGGPYGGSALTPWGLNYRLDSSLNYSRGNVFSNSMPFTVPSRYNTFTGIELSQPLLRNFWIDAARRDILISRKNVRFTELGLQSEVIRVIAATERAYYNLIFAFENVKVEEKAVELADRLVAENRRKVEVGTLAPLDETQAESQAAASRANLIAAQRTLDLQENLLKNLITDQYSELHPVRIVPAEKLIAIPETPDVQESWKRGLTLRPDLQQAKVDLERRDVNLRYYKNQVFPQLDLIGSYGRSGFSRDLGRSLHDIEAEHFPSYSYGAALSVPLSNRTARSRYRETKEAIQQALLGLKQIEQNVMIQIDDAIKLIRSNYERVLATRQARNYAEVALAAEQKKLEVGKSTSFVVLRLQRDLTSARSEEIRALADYNIALSDLAESEGSTLDRFHLDVKSR